LSQFDVPPLTEDQLQSMTNDEVMEFEAQRLNLAKAKQEISEAWDDFDHYEHGMRIIDTDYTSYMLIY
jgi:hypothetical protein